MDFCATLFTNQLKKNKAFRALSTLCSLELAREGSCGALVTAPKRRPHHHGWLRPLRCPCRGSPNLRYHVVIKRKKMCSQGSRGAQLCISCDGSVTKSGEKSQMGKFVPKGTEFLFLFVSLLLWPLLSEHILRFSVVVLL